MWARQGSDNHLGSGQVFRKNFHRGAFYLFGGAGRIMHVMLGAVLNNHHLAAHAAERGIFLSGMGVRWKSKMFLLQSGGMATAHLYNPLLQECGDVELFSVSCVGAGCRGVASVILPFSRCDVQVSLHRLHCSKQDCGVKSSLGPVSTWSIRKASQAAAKDSACHTEHLQHRCSLPVLESRLRRGSAG